MSLSRIPFRLILLFISFHLVVSSFVAGYAYSPDEVSITKLEVQTFVVNTLADGSDGLCDQTHCTLREAILAANTNAGTDTIHFNLSGEIPHTLVLNSALPTIVQPVVIDATSDPNFAGTPVVELTGTGLGSVDGLTITGGGTTLRGLVINRFAGSGIKITGTGNNLVEGNYIGTDYTGSTSLPNGGHGIYIAGSSNNRIGGTTPGSRNVISGNSGNGVLIEQSATGNQIQGNYIGTNAAGNAVIANTNGAIRIQAANSNTIGGTTGTTPGGNCTGACNLIGGSSITLASSSNTVQGNYIGVTVSGTVVLGNLDKGISISGGSNTIGGTTTAARNVIAGFTSYGIQIAGGSNVVQGNYIGTDVTGMADPDITQRGTGIFIDGGDYNRIGGPTSVIPGNLCTGSCNLISGNATGINLHYYANGNAIGGNYIGTNVAGNAVIKNTFGVSVDESSNNYIGVYQGSQPTSGNLISSSDIGIYIHSYASKNTVQGNYIGTAADGLTPLGNQKGIHVWHDAPSNTIGGTAANQPNVISGNTADGISLTSSLSTTVVGNLIGLGRDGMTPLGNGGNGISINSNSNNSIVTGNKIASNGGSGIFVQNSTSNPLSGNSIFDNSGLGIDLYPVGVTPNDLKDVDSGANNGQNYPVLTNALVSPASGKITVTGTLNSTPNTTFTIDFFGVETCDASGYGEGKTAFSIDTTPSDPEPGNPDFAAATATSSGITSDSNGNASFTYTLIGSPARAITAIVTGAGNTSEYSACIPLLNPPLSLQAKAVSPTQILLSWVDYSDIETEYRIERSLDGNNWTEIGAVAANTTSFTDDEVICDVPHIYRARAYSANTSQLSAYTSPVTTSNVCSIPTPTDLQAVVKSATRVELGWTDNAPNETAYVLERSDDGGTIWNELMRPPADAESYTDTTTTCEKIYAYRVRAVHENGQQSLASNVATAMMPLCQPTALSAVETAESEISLTWEDNSSSETGYLIERSTSVSGQWVEIASVAADVESYTDTGLACNSPHYYRVRAFRSGDGLYSPYSTTDSARTLLCQPADLSLSQTVDNANPGEVEQVVFTITVTNNGPNPATGVVVRNTIPAGLTFLVYTASQGNYTNTAWAVGTLEANASATLNLIFKVQSGFYNKAINHTAEICLSDAQDPDSTPCNNVMGEDDQATVSLLIGCAPASVFNVANGDTQGLINAIEAANNEVCYPGADTIALAENSHYTLTQSYVYDLNGYSGLPAIISAINLEGNGATIERSSTASTPSFRILYISGSMTEPGIGGNLTLNHVTIRNGLANTSTGNPNYRGSYGGGIFNWFGTVQITNATMVGNSANAYGGGIYNRGTLTLSSSLMSQNRTGSSANGAAIANEGQITVTNSTFSANQGRYTFYNSNPTSQNLLSHNTFMGNIANNAIYRQNGLLTLHANLLVDTTGQNCAGSSMTSGGYNLSDDASCAAVFTQPTDLQYTDMRVGVLADNGGLTLSAAPRSGSPAIDAIPAEDCTITTDQRGSVRPYDADGDGTAKCDIGSLEVGRADLVITKAVSNPNPQVNDPLTYTVQFTNNGPDDAHGVVVGDPLPPGFTYTSSNGGYDPASGLWTIGLVNAGSSVTLQINGFVNFAANETVTNTASLAAASVNDPEGAPQDSAEFMLPCPASTSFTIPDGDVQGLINAIDAANRESCLPGANTIRLTEGGTYILTAIHADTSGEANGLPVISSEIMIEGNGAVIRRDDNAPEFRILTVSNSGRLMLDRLAISNGHAATGAGLYNQGIVTITNSTFSSNTASGQGGAVYNDGSLTITDSELSGNRALTGGAIANRGSFTITGSSITNNAVSGDVTWGGGIANLDGTGRIENSTVSNNVVTVTGYFGGGGAIFNSRSFTIINSLLADNRAEGTYADGGAIYASENSNLIITNSTFERNMAPAGGGIYNDAGTLSVVGSTFLANHAFTQGGGIYASGYITVLNSTFSDNHAGSDGGGIAVVAASVRISYSTFYGNTAGDGGAIDDHAATTLTANVFANNIGGSCDHFGATSGGYNIADDDSCRFIGTGDKNSTNPLLDVLADNGGTTKTHALLIGSPALGLIPPQACTESTDQRGVTRPQGEGCEPGAYETTGGTPPTGSPPYVLSVNTVEDSGDGLLSQAEITDAAITEILVTFSEAVQNPDGDTEPVDVTNPMSYRLITVGADGVFQTGGCGAVKADDGAITVNGAVYDADSKTVTVTFNNHTPLPYDTYRLIICAPAIKNLEGRILDGNGDGFAGDHFFLSFSTDPQLYTADLTITQADDPDPVLVGSALTYRVTVSNNGPHRAFDAVLTDILPGGVSFASVSNPACAAAGNTVTCNLGTILKAQSQSVDITVNVGATTIAMLTNTASVTSSITDPTPANNTSIKETTRANEPPAENLIVNAADDNTDGVCGLIHCNLRDALLAANVRPGLDTISFNLPGQPPYSIKPLSALPEITDAVVLDGWSQPGFSGMPIIEINGASAGANADGFIISAGGSMVRGLVVNSFGRIGIYLKAGGSNTIQGNYIGTNVQGTAALPNKNYGVYIDNSPNNLIGGTTPQTRNLISGNTSVGLVITGANATGTAVQGNYIGTDVTGMVAINNQYGITIASSNTIIGGTEGTTPGGDCTSVCNLISGNRASAIKGFTGVNNLTIQGNYIGTTVTGEAALGNGTAIELESAGSGILIGGTTPAARNVISANDIRISATQVTVQGNYIGTDVDGEVGISPLPSVQVGGNATVGGTTPGVGNLIAGSLRVSGNSVVQGNLIGTDVTGTVLLGGSVYVNGQNTLLGGATAEARNIITNGVIVGASNTTVQGNYIGVDITGTRALGNPSNGIYVSDAQNVLIGGMNPGEGNIIANSQHDGIFVYYSPYGTASTVNIVGNSIFDNVELGIDLQKQNEPGDPGQTANDDGDTDVGANQLQNYPVLSYTVNNLTDSIIEGSVNSSANAAFRIDLYANTTCDHSGYGEGERYLGSTSVTTDGDGFAAFSMTVSPATTTNQFITATATDAVGRTSEFSACRKLKATSDLPAPSDLSASAIDPNSLDLTWVDNAADETDYRIERSSDGVNDWQEIATTGADVTTYHDGALACDATYYYRVRAFRAGTDSLSDYSAFAYAKTQPCPLVVPALQSVVALSATQVRLTWLDLSTNETAYRIERSPDGVNGWQEITSTAANAVNFEDSGLTCETAYHYRVRAFRSADDQYSDYTTAFTVTTSPCTPTDFVATSLAATQVQLTWSDYSITETAYLVERSPDGVSGWSTIATLDASATTYVDDGVCNAVYYRARAFRNADSLYSAYTNIANVVLPGCTSQAGPIFTVTTIPDTNDGRCDWLHCSLREAVAAANTYAGSSTIIIPAGEYLLTARLNVNANTSLMGAGAEKTILRVQRPANSYMQAIEIATGRTASISGVSVLDAAGDGAIINRANSVLTVSYTTIRNTWRGSGIYNQGSLTVISSLIAENMAEYRGGGIFSSGALTVIDTTIRDNSTESHSNQWLNDILGGGGIFKLGAGDLTITNSTISDNDSARHGGGVFFYQPASDVGGILTITNSTLSNNQGYYGGGIWFSDALDSATLNHITLVKNYGYEGEALYVQTGSQPLQVTNSIVAGNKGGQYSRGSAMGAVSFIGSNVVNVEPALGLLQDNGGLTFTHALLPHSPALDALPADQCAFTTDQRGVSRPYDGNQDGTAACDLGAVEMDTPLLIADLQLAKTVSTDIPNAGSSILYTLTVTNNGPDRAGHVVIRETLPIGLSFEKANASQGSYTDNLWTVGDLEAGASATLLLTIKVDVTTVTYELTSNSEIISSDSHDPDSVLNNGASAEDDYAAITVTVQLPEVCTGNTISVANGDVTGLINAVTTANNSGGCTIIELAAGGRYELTSASDSSYGSTGLPAITRRLTIWGNGAIIERSETPGTPDFRIFYIYGGNLTLNGVTIRNGRLEQQPYSDSVNYYGGGLLNRGGNVLITQSTFTANHAAYGAAIANISMGTVTVVNSTISGNNATYWGGGISNVGYNNSGRVAITNSTIANNTSSGGGGLLQDSSGYTILRSSILANNQTDNCGPLSRRYRITTRGYNLSDDDSCIPYLNDPTDRNNTPAMIEALQQNGVAFTHSLLVGSPAIDVVPTASCHEDVTNDQIGIIRPQGTACDIGAVERVRTTPPSAPSELHATAVSPTAISLTWMANTPDVTRFHVERSANGANGWLEVSTVTNNSYQDGGLTCQTAYYYRVRAFRAGDSLFSDYSATANTATDSCPSELAAPTLIAPEDASITSSAQPIFQWSAVAGAASYQLQLTYGGGVTITIPTISTSYSPANPLLTTTYSWRARAVNADNHVSAWSAAYTVTISSATDAMPERNLYTTDTPTLRWSPVTWAARYEVQIARDAAFSQLVDSQKVPANKPEITTKLLSDGSYYWRVRAINNDNVAGNWSVVDRFRVADSDGQG